jgi:hexokinase
MPMGKGFAINSSLSLGELIYTGYARHIKKTAHDDLLLSTGLPRLNIVAIANDAVATLISSMYTTGHISNRRSVVGLVLGTGCNASTVMERQCLDLQKGSSGTCTTDDAKIIVNTEWTIRGTAGPLHDLELVTAWDNAVSVGAHSPGFQPFEYMTAGSYLGEIVRVLVVDWYINVLGIPKTHLPSQLLEANGITTTFLAQSVAVSADPVALASSLNQTCTLGNNQMWTWTAELARVLLEAEKIVLRRSAALVAAALLGLLISTRDLPLERSKPGEEHDPDRRRQPQELVVGYCGGLICLYRGYREQIQDFIDAILDQISVPGQNPHHKVVLEEVSQGGLIGAAVLANMVLDTLC